MVQFDDLVGSLDDQNEAKAQADEKATELKAISDSGDKVAQAVKDSTKPTRTVKGEVKVTNPDLAKSQDVNQAVEAINKLNLTAFMSNEGLPQLAKNLTDLSVKTQNLQDNMENQGLKKMGDQLGLVVKKLDEVAKTIAKTEISVDAKLQKTIDNLSKSIGAIDFQPAVNVTAPAAKVVTTPVDLSPVVTALAAVEKAVKASEAPETNIDLGAVTQGLDSVRASIEALRFPVPNYVLPFRNQAGKADQVQLSSTGGIPVVNPNGTTISGGGGGGAANFATGQQALSSTAAQIVGARPTRTSVTIVNLSTTDIYLGASGVTTSTGQLLLGTKGAAITLAVQGAVYGIVASTTPSVSFEDEYN